MAEGMAAADETEAVEGGELVEADSARVRRLGPRALRRLRAVGRQRRAHLCRAGVDARRGEGGGGWPELR